MVLTFEEDMTVDELVQNWGSWHKSCYVKFSKEKLERATKKRDRDDAVESITWEKRPRRQSIDRMACLFCHKEDSSVARLLSKEILETHSILTSEYLFSQIF